MNQKTTEIQEWIDLYSHVLLNRALYLLSNREEAEDIVQDVFIAAFEGYANFKQKSNVQTWLMSILQHKVSDYYRKKYQHSTHIPLDHFFDETGSWKESSVTQAWNTEESQLLDQMEFREALFACLEQLPKKWLIPVKLYYLQEKKTELICQEIGITTTNLWKILQRSRLQLRACLDINWFKL